MAAAKSSYKIPYGLEQSYSDMMISLRSKDGSVGKVVPMVVVLTYILSFLVCMFMVTKTFIGSMGNPVQIALFVILWAALTVVLAKYDGTRRMNVQRVMTLLNYLPKRSRHVYTRMKNDAGPFWNILGIDSIESDGFITFLDKTYGYMYRVVGSASILLFDGDRDAIVSRVDNFIVNGMGIRRLFTSLRKKRRRCIASWRICTVGMRICVTMIRIFGTWAKNRPVF